MFSRLLHQNFHSITRQCTVPLPQAFLSSSRLSIFSRNASLHPVGFELTVARRSFSRTTHLKTLFTSPSKTTGTNFDRAFALGGTVALGLGLTALSKPEARCEGAPSPSPNSQLDVPSAPLPPAGVPPPPRSSVNVYELSFGTVCGICAGVFVKKGVKTVAFLLGGIFVILQYFGSLSLVRVNWSRFQSTFENAFYHVENDGTKRAPTISSLFVWIFDFLTADFPPRATFLAGFLLGLRLG
ncbi:hypothetical protein SCHPADRAFT_993320 [Schizopora paradoxa]|uniref:FUN14-domain-containing protein n=1 Tax=Schizopora paradoxa TaxID=27342 RepID=A0A0H2S2X1_9AGAM|nr:hypothetical protein SCHPADRAFT_993320 [Schizopora paradoxa]